VEGCWAVVGGSAGLDRAVNYLIQPDATDLSGLSSHCRTASIFLHYTLFFPLTSPPPLQTTATTPLLSFLQTSASKKKMCHGGSGGGVKGLWCVNQTSF